MNQQATCEIIAVGNELLIGKTLDTNSNWLAKTISSLGMAVKRITIIEDDVSAIQAAISESLSRKPTLIITTGGLGPTFDDMTLEGVSKALGMPLKLNKTAYKMLRESYRRRFSISELKHIKMTPARKKMAIIPFGSTPINNPVGSAPGVLIKREDSTIVILPGVPSEMKAIFEETVEPMVKMLPGLSQVCEKTLTVIDIMESSLAPLIDQVMKNNPRAYIKSHPKGAEHHFLLELHIRVADQNPDVVKKTLEDTVNQIVSLILQNGGKIKSVE